MMLLTDAHINMINLQFLRRLDFENGQFNYDDDDDAVAIELQFIMTRDFQMKLKLYNEF